MFFDIALNIFKHLEQQYWIDFARTNKDCYDAYKTLLDESEPKLYSGLHFDIATRENRIVDIIVHFNKTNYETNFDVAMKDACFSNNLRMVKLFLTKNAKLNEFHLSIACSLGYYKLTKLIAEKLNDIDKETYFMMTYMSAKDKECLNECFYCQIMKYFIENGFDIENIPKYLTNHHFIFSNQ